MEPAPDRRAAEAAKRDVERVDDGQVVVDRLEGRIERVTAGIRQRRRPEVVEVVRPGQVGSIGAELIEWQVELRHGGLPCGLDPDSMERPACRSRVASTGSA